MELVNFAFKNINRLVMNYCDVDNCSEFVLDASLKLCKLHSQSPYLTHRSKPDICTGCGLWFKSRNKLFQHLRSNGSCIRYKKKIDICTFAGNLCDLPYQNPYEYEFEPAYIIRCKNCGYSARTGFYSEQGFMCHNCVTLNPLNPRPQFVNLSQCDNGHITITSKSHLVFSKLKDSLRVLCIVCFENRPKPDICDCCDVWFPSRNALFRHINS
jgi:C2H2-type zinc finger protein